jgi:hypothetical protein
MLTTLLVRWSDLLNDMRRSRSAPTEEVYGHVIACVCTRGLWQQFTEILRAMKQDGIELSLVSRLHFEYRVTISDSL